MNNPTIIQYLYIAVTCLSVVRFSVLYGAWNSYAFAIQITNIYAMEIKKHTLAFVRWINACNSMEQLNFCHLAMLQFLIRGDNRYELPTATWKDIDTYLTLCMQNKRRMLQQAWFNNILPTKEVFLCRIS